MEQGAEVRKERDVYSSKDIERANLILEITAGRLLTPDIRGRLKFSDTNMDNREHLLLGFHPSRSLSCSLRI